MGNKKLNRDLALKVLEVAGAVRDALDDLLETMFIIYQPKDHVGAVGETASFTVVAMNVTSYQWEVYRSGTWQNTYGTGYNTDTITYEITNTTRNFKWRCKLTDSDGNIIYTDVVAIIIETT